MVKGTDASHSRFRRRTLFVVEPGPANGLLKTTAFELAPRVFSIRRILLLHPDRRMGRLDSTELTSIRREMERLFARGHQGSP